MLVNKPITKAEYTMRAPERVRKLIRAILDDYSDDEEYYIDDFNSTLKTVDIESYIDNMSIC